jgi:protein-S-isoprenylcysteine O-methyltransferase Ste14
MNAAGLRDAVSKDAREADSGVARSKARWNVVGWLVHAFFVVTACSIFVFLRGPDIAPATPTKNALGVNLAIDASLLLLFAVPHSLFLRPAMRDRLSKRIPGPMYGVFFCLVTCVTLVAVIVFWRPAGGVVWHATGVASDVVRAGYYCSWFGLFYSLWLNGLGYQTGWVPWRTWMAGKQPPRREFHPSSVYRVLRHPVYLSFLGLIWFAPVVTVDRALLISLWTAYVFIGSCFKDRRLEFYLGDSYRRYSAEVPGYPGMFIGPLGRRRIDGRA